MTGWPRRDSLNLIGRKSFQISDELQRSGIRLGDLRPAHRGVQHHQPGSPALFRCFDDRALKPRDLGAPWFDHRAVTDERNQPLDTQLGRFFDQPVEPIRLGNRRSQHEREGGSSVSGIGRSNGDQIDPIVAHGDDFRPGRAPASVEDLDLVTGAEPANAAQVPGLAGFEPVNAVAGGVGTVEPGGHASTPVLAKDRGASYPIVGIDGDESTTQRRCRPAVAERVSLLWNTRLHQLFVTQHRKDNPSVEVSLGPRRDPFAESDALYVPLPTHDEAVARLIHTIENGGASGLRDRRGRTGKKHGPASGVRGDAESAAPVRPGELFPRGNAAALRSSPSVWANASAASRAGWLRGGLSSVRSAWRPCREFTLFSASTIATSRARTLRRDIRVARRTSDRHEHAAHGHPVRTTIASGTETIAGGSRSDSNRSRDRRLRPFSRRNSPRAAVGKARSPRGPSRGFTVSARAFLEASSSLRCAA